MSTMLEDAILDAEQLRSAALRSAEALIVEKYSDEIKGAMQNLLEQEPELEALPASGEEEEEESTVMVDIPSGQSKDDSDEVVTIDLDQIIAAAQEEPTNSYEMDEKEIAQEIGIDIEDDAPANREDLELDENDLVDLFSEMLAIDVEDTFISAAEDAVPEEELQDEIQSFVKAEDGVDPKDLEVSKGLEENRKLKKRVKTLLEQNKELTNLIVRVKDRLEEVNLSNARLLYSNYVHGDASLNEQQRSKIVEHISSAKSTEEAKMLYETLQRTLEGRGRSRSPKSLSEAVTRRSSMVISGKNHDESNHSKDDTRKVRWAKLAGLGKN
jgi:hypothetical protein